QQEEGVQPAGARLIPLIGAVEIRLVHAAAMELFDPLAGLHPQLDELAILDRAGRARLGADRHHVRLQPVVAERALPRAAVVLVTRDHAEWTGDDAIPAAIADVRLDIDGAELGPDDGARRARFEARGVSAVLADVAEHQPGEIPEARLLAAQLLVALDERDV